jgi:hypothetical protein
MLRAAFPGHMKHGMGDPVDWTLTENMTFVALRA